MLTYYALLFDSPLALDKFLRRIPENCTPTLQYHLQTSSPSSLAEELVGGRPIAIEVSDDGEAEKPAEARFEADLKAARQLLVERSR